MSGDDLVLICLYSDWSKLTIFEGDIFMLVFLRFVSSLTTGLKELLTGCCIEPSMMNHKNQNSPIYMDVRDKPKPTTIHESL